MGRKKLNESTVDLTKELGIGIISWNNPIELDYTLSSYAFLFNSVPKKNVLIFFQQISEKDKMIANKHGIDFVGSPVNVGISSAFLALTKIMNQEHILLLENDWLSIEDESTIKDRLQAGVEVLKEDVTQVVRYRHRKYPGQPLYTEQYKGKELTFPTHIMDAVHWLRKPDTAYPEIFSTHVTRNEQLFYITDATHANFTNNPCMYKRAWYNKTVSRFDSPGVGLEGKIQSWWQTQTDIKVAMGEGLFVHKP